MSRRLAGFELATEFSDRAEPFREHFVVVNRLEVQLARENEVAVVQGHVALERRLERDPHRVLDEAGLQMRVLDDEELVGPLQQLVDRRAHRRFDDRNELLRVYVRRRADVQGPPPPLVVRRERHEAQDPLDVYVVESGVQQSPARAAAYETLRAWTRVDAGCLDADEAPRPAR